VYEYAEYPQYPKARAKKAKSRNLPKIFISILPKNGVPAHLAPSRDASSKWKFDEINNL
jgi:hypothetical protein